MTAILIVRGVEVHGSERVCVYALLLAPRYEAACAAEYFALIIAVCVVNNLDQASARDMQHDFDHA